MTEQRDKLSDFILEQFSPLLPEAVGYDYALQVADDVADEILHGIVNDPADNSEAHRKLAPRTIKHFTDAELVAEYWAVHGEANQTMTGNPPLRFSQRHILRRFATTPHYRGEME